MAQDRSSRGAGVGVCGLLGVAFVVLKLCGVIDWSWWWVLAPFWVPVAVALLVVVVVFGFLACGELLFGKK